MQNGVVKAAVVLDFLCIVLPVLHLCHRMSDTHYDPNETVNSPITGKEMSIITLPKVATEEIVFGSQISGKTKDVA